MACRWGLRDTAVTENWPSALVLHAASTFSVLIIGTLAIDWFSDGDLDVLRLLLG